MLFSVIVALFAFVSTAVFAEQDGHRHHHHRSQSHSHELPNPIVCAQELAAITYQPNVCGVTFLKNLALSITSDPSVTFGPQAENTFSSQFSLYGVGFTVYNAMGIAEFHSGSVAVPSDFAFSHAIELAYSQGSGYDNFTLIENSIPVSYYGFAIRLTNLDGQVIILYIYAPKAALPSIC